MADAETSETFAETLGATLAFLLTDIEGSSGRWERDRRGMQDALARHDGVLRAAVTASGGQVFKHTGDGMFAVFGTAAAAAAAALRAQQALAGADFTAAGGLPVRMAVHAGPAAAREGDYFGPAVNRAARLLAAAHGGQILVSAAAAALCGPALPATAYLLDLGEHRLKDFPRAETIFQLAGGGLKDRFPPLNSLEAHAHNLPRQVTSFIGRDAELAEVTGLMASHRLITIAGPGGIGKTRLALCAAAELLPRFADGEWFLALAPLTADTQVAEALASLLGLTLQGQQAAEAVARYLKPRQALIILDNCEHLLDGTAALADALLSLAPEITVLATSREPLGVQGEKIYRIPALACPPAGDVSVDAAMRYAAVSLFAARAELAAGGFALTAQTAPVVAEICRRLDGMPLAIELAAARIRMLAPAELLAGLKDRFKLLTGGARTAERRQQTLKALIGWSYNLLSEPERLLFRRLAVFGGSFTIELAAGVAAFGAIGAGDVFNLLAALLDKSMVSALAGEGETRYRLLESTRQYGAEALAESGEAPAAQRRLAAAMLGFHAGGEACWATTDSAAWRAKYTADVDNLRAALEWALGEHGDTQLGLALISQSLSVWPELALVMERHRWAAAAAELITPETPPAVEAPIMSCLAGWGYPQKARRRAAAERALALFRRLGDDEGIARSAAMLANHCINPDDMAASRAYRDEAMAILPKLAVSKRRAITLNNLAVISSIEGDVARATALTGEAYDIAKTFGDQILLQNYGINLGEWLFLQGDYEGALARAEEVAESCRQSRDTLRRAYAVMNLIAYNLMLGNLQAARAAGQEAIPLHLANADEYGIAVSAEDMALLAARSGDLATAARLAGYGDAYYRANDLTRTGTELAIWTELTKDLAANPNQTAQMSEGATWTPRQAMDRALGV